MTRRRGWRDGRCEKEAGFPYIASRPGPVSSFKRPTPVPTLPTLFGFQIRGSVELN